MLFVTIRVTSAFALQYRWKVSTNPYAKTVIKNSCNKLGKETHTSNSSAWEVEAGRSRIRGQPGLHSECQANMGYMVTLGQKEIM
jgi:hypothetical protein